MINTLISIILPFFGEGLKIIILYKRKSLYLTLSSHINTKKWGQIRKTLEFPD